MSRALPGLFKGGTRHNCGKKAWKGNSRKLRQEDGHESRASLPPKWGLVSNSNNEERIILESSIFTSVFIVYRKWSTFLQSYFSVFYI